MIYKPPYTSKTSHPTRPSYFHALPSSPFQSLLTPQMSHPNKVSPTQPIVSEQIISSHLTPSTKPTSRLLRETSTHSVPKNINTTIRTHDITITITTPANSKCPTLTTPTGPPTHPTPRPRTPPTGPTTHTHAPHLPTQLTTTTTTNLPPLPHQHSIPAATGTTTTSAPRTPKTSGTSTTKTPSAPPKSKARVIGAVRYWMRRVSCSVGARARGRRGG